MNFETSEVYELIDSIIVDSIVQNNYSNTGDCEVVCNSCGCYVDYYAYMDFKEASIHIIHVKDCTYLLALSMNTGRDYKKYPSNIE